jgi:hypothetical protein
LAARGGRRELGMERKREVLVKAKERIRLGSGFGRRREWMLREERAERTRSAGREGVEEGESGGGEV